jgi:hypothetical protein
MMKSGFFFILTAFSLCCCISTHSSAQERDYLDNLTYIEISRYSSQTITIVKFDDFLSMIKSKKINEVFYTDTLFLFYEGSYLFTIIRNGYKSLPDYSAGTATGFKDGDNYYYAKENGLNSQEEVYYYKSSGFLSVSDYRDAQKNGFINNNSREFINSLNGLIATTELQKNIKYANALIFKYNRYRTGSTTGDTEYFTNTDIGFLASHSNGTIRILKYGVIYFKMPVQVMVQNEQDALLYYACKAGGWSGFEEWSGRVDKQASIKNSASVLAKLNFNVIRDILDADSSNFDNSSDYYLAKEFNITSNELRSHRTMVNEIKSTMNTYKTSNKIYALAMIYLLTKWNGNSIAISVFSNDFQKEYSNNPVVIKMQNRGFYFSDGDFKRMYQEIGELKNIINYGDEAFHKK